jgi:hypothetical protein
MVYVELELVWFLCSKSISSGAQDVTLPKYFSHPSFSLCTLFANPTDRTETGDSKEVRGLLIANHLDQSFIMIDQLEILSRSQIIFITLFSASAQPGRQRAQLCGAQKNHFPEPNRHMLDFLHPI